MAWAPEVAEEASFGIAEFATLMALVGLVTLRFSYAMTLGRILSALVAVLNVKIGVGIGPSVRPFGFLAGWLDTLNKDIYRWLSDGIKGTEYAWHKLLSWNAYVLTKTGDEIASVSYALLEWAHLVRRDVSPAAIRAATRPFIQQYVGTVTVPAVTATPRVKVAHTTSTVSAARVTRLEREVAALRAAVLAEPVAVPQTTAPAVALPAPVPLPRRVPGLAEVWRGIDALGSRLGKLGRLGTVAGIAGLVLAALGRVGLPWLKCSRVDRVGRSLCGMDQSLLESLLADTLLIVGTVSLVEFAKGMQGIVGEFEQPVRKFWRAV